MRLQRQDVHGFIYFFGLLVFAAVLPLSRYFLSLALWLLSANLIFGGDYRTKLNRLWKNKPILIFIGIFLLHIIGIIWSNDISYALKDIRVKLPLLILPIIMAAEPLIPFKRFKWILLVHAMGVIAGSLFILWRIYGLGISDTREASMLISHIRFALNICVAIFSLIYFLFRPNGFHWQYRLLLGAGLIWLLIFLFILQSFTGLVIFGIIVLILLLRETIRQSRRSVKLAISLVIILLLGLSSAWIVHFYNKNFKSEPVNTKILEFYTPRGNPYTHNTRNLQKENGNYLWLYVCFPELEETWNRRSEIDFDSLDRSGQDIQYTLIRFLTSKGYRKDSDGVSSLTNDEIFAIENGVANYEEIEKPGFVRRIENVLWELDDFSHTGDPKQHSFMQRVELWKASLNIIFAHPIIGVGTGDVPDEFASALKEMNSPLKNTDMRSHNQYLAIAVTFGIPGFFFFLFALFYAPWKQKLLSRYFFLTFILIGLLSMLTEDTLESQQGVSFFVFFYCLFLFTADKYMKNKIEVS